MPVIELETKIHAGISRVFDLSRSIDAHMASTVASSERAVAGVTRGLIGLGQSVTWEATHFGVRQRLSVSITRFERPTEFEDRMISGAFKMMCHRHTFAETAGVTTMRDRFEFAAPLGPLGRLAETLFLTRYMRGLLTIRNAEIKKWAESSEGDRFLRAP